ncbi:MAG: GldG family protein [Nitrospirae bacterium]|nr:GldG family protein [Nitrospirota bacterium]
MLTNLIGLLGILLVVGGGLVYAINTVITTASASLIFTGLLLLLIYFYINFARIRDLLIKRSSKYGANMAVMILIFLCVLALIAVMSTRYKKRIDLTATNRYTLSEQTKKILKSLKKEIEAVAFYRADERTRQAMEDLLQEYSYYSPRFKHQFVDPDRTPAVAAKYGVSSYRTTLLIAGKRQETVALESEEKLTNAIIKVTRDDVKVVYFVSGHGENSITDFQKNGYKAAKEAIEKENYEARALVLLNIEEIPKDASLIIISGPSKDFVSSEIEKLEQYIMRGGKVLVMLDPGRVHNLVPFLSKYGFIIGDDIIIDKLSQVFGANYLTPVVTEYDDRHPITKDFNVATFFPLARSVEIKKDLSKGAYPFARTGQNSWAETDKKALEAGKAEYQEGKDIRGPVTIGAVTAVEAAGKDEGGRKRYARIVVYGDSDFANNTNLNLAGNKDLFLNTVSFLAEEEDLIAIRSKESEATAVVLTATQVRLIFWLSVVVFPSVVLASGLVIYSRRR